MIISIDGACRRNGKPDCFSTGAAFVKSTELGMFVTEETNSTNQRGELSALIMGLHVGLIELRENPDETVYLISDSEYVVNGINKEWYKNWKRKGWITADGNPVKNRDLWEKATVLLDQYGSDNLAVYHTKGHLVSVGKVTAANILSTDAPLMDLYELVANKYDEFLINPSKKDALDHARNLFLRNNNALPPDDVYKDIVVCNTVTDLVASWHADCLSNSGW